jgi:hypothetical protein
MQNGWRAGLFASAENVEQRGFGIDEKKEG